MRPTEPGELRQCWCRPSTAPSGARYAARRCCRAASCRTACWRGDPAVRRGVNLAGRALQHRRAARPGATPVRGGGSRRWALFGRIHTGGDGRHTARGCVEAVGVVCPTSRPATKCVVVRRPVDVDRTYQDLSLDMVRNTRRISTLTPSAGHHWWYGNFAPVTEFLNTATSERI